MAVALSEENMRFNLSTIRDI